VVELSSIVERLVVEDFVVDNGARPYVRSRSRSSSTPARSRVNRPMALPPQRADETPTTGVAGSAAVVRVGESGSERRGRARDAQASQPAAELPQLRVTAGRDDGLGVGVAPSPKVLQNCDESNTSPP
jgi:hypothetical protein